MGSKKTEVDRNIVIAKLKQNDDVKRFLAIF